MKQKTKKNDFLMQGSVLAMAGLITRLIGMVYRVILTRIVGTEGMAYYNTAYEIYNLALLISTYSIPVAISKIVADRDSKGQYVNSNRVFHVGLLVSSTIGFFASFLLLIFSGPLASFMKWPSAAIPLRVLAPTIFIFSIMGIIRGFFQGKKTMVPTAFSQVIEQIFNAIASVLAAWLLIRAHKDAADVAAYGAAGGTTGTLVGAIFGLAFLIFVKRINNYYFDHKCLKDHTNIIDSDSEITRTILLTMLPIILSQTVYQISGILDNYIFSAMMFKKGMEESAKALLYEAYSNKYKWLYNLPVAIASSFGVTIVPILSASFAKKNMKMVREKCHSAIKLNMIVAIPSAVGLGVLARPIMLMLFNRSADELSPVLMQLGCIAVVFFALSTLTNGILQGVNLMRLPIIHAAAALVVHIPLLIILLGPLNFGVYGMVIGNCTYGLMVCILNWNSMRTRLGYRQELVTSFIKPAEAAGGMGIVAWAVYKVVFMITKINLIATLMALVLAVLTYFALLILFKGVTEEELLGFPMGGRLVRLAKKLKLMRDESADKNKSDRNIKDDVD
ncbi:MAG: polysaccharide biosynthesis protein [Lachnospiraceae bacterium]|nr:polysaccharide biosynthesis protein [Lachnospiraceae bacterium]